MSNKIVDGVELLRLIRDGKIKNKQTFENINEDLLLTYENGVLYYYNERVESDCELFKDYSLNSVLKCNFEILSEEDEEIDIQSIEEFEFGEIEDKNNYETRYKINELIKAVKKLDKKIKEEE